jgi:hypothetical protein
MMEQDVFRNGLSATSLGIKNNGITERNLSFQFAVSFLNRFPDGHVFTEVPFSLSSKRADKHLDAYLFNDTYSIFLECKIVWAESHFNAISADIVRIPKMVKEVQNRHTNAICPIPYGMILAETWRDDVANWWRGDNDSKKWSRDILPPNWHYDFIEVHKDHGEFEGTLYWLYAVSPELSEDNIP